MPSPSSVPGPNQPEDAADLLPIDLDAVRAQIRAAVARRRDHSLSTSSGGGLRSSGSETSLLLRQYLARRPRPGSKASRLSAWMRRPVDFALRQMTRVVNVCTIPLKLTILDHIWHLSQAVEQLRRSVEASQPSRPAVETHEPKRKSA